MVSKVVKGEGEWGVMSIRIVRGGVIIKNGKILDVFPNRGGGGQKTNKNV